MNRCLNKLAMLNTLTMLPPKTLNKKYRLVCLIKADNLSAASNSIAFRFNDLRELINSSYISVMRAIVPPETPGITFAIPMAIPFMKRTI